MKRGLFQILIANIVSLMIGIGLSFLVPKYLSVDSYALYKTYALYITYAGFFHFGYADGMYLKYGGKDIDKIDKNDLATNYKNFLCLIAIVTLLFLGIGFFTNDYVIIAFSIGQFSTNLLGYLRSLYQATGEFSAYSRALNFEKIGIFIFTILFLLVLHSDNYLIYIGIQAVVGVIVSIYLLFKLEHRLRFMNKGRFSMAEWKENISSGIILMLGNFSSSVFTGLDRWFVKFLMQNIHFALYSFSASLLNLLNVFITPITVSLYNYFCRGISEEKIKQLKRLVLAWGLLLIAAAFPVKWILINYLNKYIKATEIVFILFAAQIFIAVIQGIYVNLYKAKHLQKLYLFQMLIMLIIGIISNGIFYYIFKSMEAFAYATLFTYFIWFVLCEKRNCEIRYGKQDYISILILIGVYLIAGFKLNPIVGLIIYAIMYIFIIKFFMPDVFEFVLDMLGSIKRK